MWGNFTEQGNVSSDHTPRKAWSSTALTAFLPVDTGEKKPSSIWARWHESTCHGNSPCTSMAAHAVLHRLPHSPRAWLGGQGDVLEHPRGPRPQHLQLENTGDGAAEPRPGVLRPPQHLGVSQSLMRLSSPHLCMVLPHFTTPRIRHFQERSDI